MSCTAEFSMNDTTSTGKIILSNDNFTTIGGNSRENLMDITIVIKVYILL